jgi:general secretion pathway protein D
MNKTLIASFLPYLLVSLAEGPYAFAQTQGVVQPIQQGTTAAGGTSATGSSGTGGTSGAPGSGGTAAPAQTPPAPTPPAPTPPAPTPPAGQAPAVTPPPVAPSAAPTGTPPAPGTAPAAPAPAPLPTVSPPVVLPPSVTQPSTTPTPPSPPVDLFSPSRRRAVDAVRGQRRTGAGGAGGRAGQAGRPGTPPRAMEAPPAPTPAPAAGAAAPAGSTISVNNAGEGVTELPGEKEFNQCKKLPPGKRILKFNFKPDSELTDLIGWISTISCTQFIIPSQVPLAGKKVTILAPQLITPEEAYRLFLAALDASNLTVESTGKFLKIIETGRARFSDMPFYKDGSGATGGGKRYITRLFRFENLEATDVLNSLYNQVRGEQGVGVAYQGSLIITDQAAMIDRFAEIARELDQPQGPKDKIWMVRIKNTSAAEMASRLAEIFSVQQLGTGGRRAGGAAPPPPAPAGAPKPPQVRKDLTSQLTITKLIPDERSNQLIVVANEQAYEWLLTILKKLDVPIEGGGDGRFHIYYCEFANCDELAQTLSAVTGVPVSGGGGVRRTSRTATPGQAPAPAPAAGAAGATQAIPQLFEGEVRVTFDGATNSLVVYSSLKDYQALRRVIDKLDAPRKQVYVEAMIMEVLLDKTRDVGVAYHGGLPFNVGGKESLALGGFNAGQTLSPASLATDLVGLAGAVFGPALESATSRLFGTQVDIPSFGAFIKLLQKNNDINVLSTPSITITNNQEGEITVGQRLPFPGSLGFGFGGTPTAPGAGGLGGILPQVSVQREDVSLKMKLLPSVNEHNQIRIDVDVEISDLVSANFNGLGPATSKRTAKTPIICKDQQTVVIGGLTTDRVSETVQKVPVLGDIPLIGFLFRNSSKQTVKSNIIIALTPYVITDTDDMRRIAEKKMRERREFIDRYSSVEDKANFDTGIDYRRKRGMLEEINRAAKEIDDEEAALRRLRERDLMEESTPIELPSQGVPQAGSKRPATPVAPPAPPTEAPATLGREDGSTAAAGRAVAVQGR